MGIVDQDTFIMATLDIVNMAVGLTDIIVLLMLDVVFHVSIYKHDSNSALYC